MKKLLIATALFAALPMASMAAEKSYTFVEGGYVNVDGDADGAYVRGNYEFGQSNVYLTGAYGDVEVHGTDFNVRSADLGVGYHYGLNERFDLTGELAAERIDTSFGNANGYRASVGTRFDITPSLEGGAQVNHYNGRDFAAENTGTVSALYKFGQTWGVNGAVEFNNDGGQAYQLGVQARF